MYEIKRAGNVKLWPAKIPLLIIALTMTIH